MMAKLDNVATGVENITKSFTGINIDELLGPLLGFIKDNCEPLTATIAKVNAMPREMAGQLTEGKGTLGKLFKDEKLLPYIVSMSPFMGEETALADLILPDCPYLERWEPESMPNSLWPWLGIRQPVIKPLGESRENRIIMRDIIHKLDPDGSRGMKQYWNFKDGEDYMRQHFGT